MATYKGGLLKVGTLNATGGSGALEATTANITTLTAVNVNATNIGLTNDLAITGDLDVSGNLTVSGSITNGTISTDVSGNLSVVGTVIPNYNVAYTPFIDYWSGLWTYTLSGNNSDLCIILKPNNTYTILYNGNENFNLSYNNQFRSNSFIKLADNIRPTIVGTDVSLSLSFPFYNNGPSTTTIIFSKKLTEPDSDYAFQVSGKATNSDPAYQWMERKMKPSDFSDSTNWDTIFLSTYDSKRIQTQAQFSTYQDIYSLWDDVKNRLISGGGLDAISYEFDVVTSKKTRVNKKNDTIFDILSLHSKLTTEKIDFSFQVTDVSIAPLVEQNILLVAYDFEDAFEQNPLTVWSEVSFNESFIPNTSDFKFLLSYTQRSPCHRTWNNFQGKSPTTYVGVRLPLYIATDVNLTITLNGIDTDITVPMGNYYTHSLAHVISVELENMGSNLRMDFYSAFVDYAQPTILDSSVNNFFYVTSDEEPTGSMTIVSDVSGFVSNILGMSSLSYVDNSDATRVSSFTFAGIIENGDFPDYSYRGTKPTDKWYTEFDPSGNDITTLKIQSSLGNVTTSGNPRDYYSCVQYLRDKACTEQHSWINVLALQDLDEEYYIPDTWKEAEYKFDDLIAKSVRFLCSQNYETNFDKSNFGLGVAQHYDKVWNGGVRKEPWLLPGYYGYRIFSIPDSSSGTTNFNKSNQMYTYYASAKKIIPPSVLETLVTKSYTYENYFSEYFILCHKFTTTDPSVNLLDTTLYDRVDLCNIYDFGVFGAFYPNLSGSIELVPFNDPIVDTSNTAYFCAWSGGCTVGLVKQSITNKLIDSSGSPVVGSFSYNTGFRINDGYIYFSKVAKYFTDNGVTHIVHDGRLNPGGSVPIRSLPYGPNITIRSEDTSRYAGTNIATNKTIKMMSTNTLVKEINENPLNWPSRMRLSTTRTVAQSINKNLYFSMSGSNEYGYGIIVKCGRGYKFGGNSTTGEGNYLPSNVKVCYLTSGTSGSAALAQMSMYTRRGLDTSGNYTNDRYDIGNNTLVNWYGTNAILWDADFAPDTALVPNVYIGGALDNSPFTYMKYAQNYTGKDGTKKLGEYGPPNRVDALSDYTDHVLLTELGLTIDSSGYNIDQNDSTTWRDFRFERSIQVANGARGLVRADDKFGNLISNFGTNGHLPYNIFS